MITGGVDADTVSTMAVRLAALERKLPPADLARVVEASGGPGLHEIAASLMDSLDNDRIAAAVERDDPPLTDKKFDATAKRMRAEALRVLADAPALRKLLVELKTQSQATIDEFSRDAVIGASFDESPRAGSPRKRIDRGPMTFMFNRLIDATLVTAQSAEIGLPLVRPSLARGPPSPRRRGEGVTAP